ncbi:MAG: substrate-binding domain-containing protein [Synergistaceae bacterium]|jgi:ABC-type lipoprotein export system ATPase subunit|nr:substrate-binding domain-containing protein [Synergistaceae bacterium]
MAAVVEMRNINKSFHGVKVLSDVSAVVEKGEIHAIVGENGAGKSTLMKILGGLYSKDSGELLINGRSVELKSIHDAIANGISVIYQELNLMPALTVAENIFVSDMPGKMGAVNYRELNRKTQALIDSLSLSLSIKPGDYVSMLSVSQRQMVEILKATCVFATNIPTLGIVPATTITILGGAVCGLLNGLAITKLKIRTFVATLAMGMIIKGAALVYTDGAKAMIGRTNNPEAKFFSQNVSIGSLQLQLTPLLMTLAVFLTGYLAYRYTRFGVYSRCIGSNENSARTSGIPVDRTIITIFMLTGITAYDVIVISDCYAGGQTAADYTVKLLGEKTGSKKAAIIKCEPSAVYAIRRGQGYKANIEAAGFTVVSELSGHSKSEEGYTIMQDVLASNPDIVAVFAENDPMAVGAANALADAGRKDIIVIGFNGDGEALDAMAAGTMQGTVAQDPFGMGSLTADLADKLVKGEKITFDNEAEREIFAAVKLLTPEGK